MEEIFDLQEILQKCLQPIDNPISECYGCTAGMCGLSRTPECRGDQYDYNKNLSWKPTEKQINEFINNQRFKKLDEILNF